MPRLPLENRRVIGLKSSPAVAARAGSKPRRSSKTDLANIGPKVIGRCRWGYTAAGYPRQRFGGYEFELPCLSRPEPRRWAERQPTTYPYKVLSIRETLSHILAPDLSDDRYSFDRLRDLRTHIAERSRHSGALFQNKQNPTKYQFARGIRWAELDGIEQHRRHDQLRWSISLTTADGEQGDALPKWLQDKKESRLFSRMRAGMRTAGRLDHIIALDEGFEFEDVDIIRIRERRGMPPLRERQKPGPKPTYNGRSGSSTERSRRRRERLRAAQNTTRSPTHRARSSTA
jgi:hypothetical protein